MSVSVLVVGGGRVGTLLALRLSEGGCTVQVLDAGRAGAEASSAAAGILAAQSEATTPGPGLDLGLDVFEARAALEEASSGPLSLVAALLSSFVPFGPIAAWLAAAGGQPLPRRVQALAWAALAMYLLMSTSLGSRSLVLVCAHCPLLKSLSVARTKAGDATVCEAALHCPKLEALYADHTNVTDLSVDMMAKHSSNLRGLYVAGTKVSEAAKKRALRQA